MELFESADIDMDCSSPLRSDLWKAVAYEAETVRSDVKVLFADGATRSFLDRHEDLRGALPSLGCYAFRNCFVGHGGLVVSQRRRIFDAPDLITPYWKQVVGTQMVLENSGNPLPAFIAGDAAVPVRDLPEDVDIVSIANPGCQVYGHWLLDILPMLWLFHKTVPFLPLRGHPKILIPLRTPAYAQAMICDVFGITGQDLIEYDDLKEIVRASTLYVPSMMRVSPRMSPRMNDFVSTVATKLCRASPGAAADTPRRFMISRRAYHRSYARLLANERAVEEVARSRGLHIVEPEKLSWSDQVNLFQNAEVVAGESGSGLHNTLFSTEGTKILVLGNSQTNWNQSAIAALRSQEIGYLFPKNEWKSEAGGIMIEHDIDILARRLDELVST
jgi:hypothetical protein